MPLWVSWFSYEVHDVMLQGCLDLTTPGFLDNEELRVLLECSVGLTLHTDRTLLTLWDVRALGNQNRYFVDVSQWKEALNGVESAALIPVVCRVFYFYNVDVCLSGETSRDQAGKSPGKS